MSSTYLSLHYHIVFGTKYRTPSISEEWREQLHRYMGGIVRGLDGVPEGINGPYDHVHILVGLSSSHRLCDFVRELKRISSHWIRIEWEVDQFAWQVGYSAFTVSERDRKGLQRYVARQMEHHIGRPFREELCELLQKSGVECNPRYLD